ncbi:hypothetical protein BD626DRAFT_404035 [Schizophyllum amplum]|uniref:BTB domain-containing protein n=1 Tax=Schizophyllum amplum TaxID=97359 RepID=A0A550CBZ5_9AGAR|nr:hypothetical protein BD626DRAFT_404035 [Auriculariopsis ampla]
MAPNETYGALRRHEEYYINGGDLHLVVDRTRFRIHRYFYERESEFFRRILLAPASPGATRQGTSDENAIELDYVSSDEFAKFNWVFYNPKYSLYDKSSKDWIIILRLAYRWGFPNVHGLAVRELDKLYVPDIERVSIYQDYAVDRRKLVPCYAAIAERAQPLSLDEGERLGLETVIMLAQAREYARAGPQHDLAPAGLRQDEMEEIVKEVFDIEALPVDQLYPTAYEASNGSVRLSL